jgi:hypothetical protein
LPAAVRFIPKLQETTRTVLAASTYEDRFSEIRLTEKCIMQTSQQQLIAESLTRLRSQVDLSTYETSDDAPGWLRSLAENALHQLGAMALVGPSGMSVTDEGGMRLRAVLDGADLFLVGVCCQIRASGQKVAVGLPPISRHLPLLLAGSAVLDDVLIAATSQNPVDYGRVLVVSPDLDVRSRYCDLYVKSSPLEEAYPGSRMLPDGQVIALQNDRDISHSNGVCFFLAGRQLPETIAFVPSLIIMDLRYARWSPRATDLIKWATKVKGKSGLIVLYSLGDTDTHSSLANHNFIDLPFDHAAIATCSNKVNPHPRPQKELLVDWRTEDANFSLERTHEIEVIPNCEAADRLICQIGKLVDEHSKVQSPDLNRARWLLAMFSQIPVPIRWYEDTARSLGRSLLSRMIDYLGIKSRHIEGIGAVMQTLRMQFKNLHQMLESTNPRAEALLTLLTRAVQEKPSSDRMLLLVRDRVMARALENWLHVEALKDAIWLQQVDIECCSEFARLSASRHAISLINANFPRRYRWIAGAALGRKVVFLAYPHEIEVIESQLQHFYGDKALSYRRRKRAQAINQICAVIKEDDNDSDSAIPSLKLKKPSVTTGKPAIKNIQTATDLSQLKDLLTATRKVTDKLEDEAGNASVSTWKEDSSDDQLLFDGLETNDVAPTAEDFMCLCLEVNSRVGGVGLIWLPTDEPVECVRAARPDDICRMIPSHLRPGDILLRMDDEGRTTLFDRIVELAEDQPEMQFLASFRQTWRRSVQTAVSRFGGPYATDYKAMLRELQTNGARIQTEQTVRNWALDYVIGPDEISSIVAVGRVSGVSLMVRRAKEFDRSFRRIRGIRQAIGQRLNNTIRKSFKTFAEGSVDPYAFQLEDRLGIPVDELLETIDLAEVISINKQEQRMPFHSVGRFQSV